MNKILDEVNPLFPSGEWEGFYVYRQNKNKHNMSFSLEFKNGAITGSGGDDVGSFKWRGTYNIDTLKCNIIKDYSSHKIIYNGEVDENGIWGIWQCDLDPLNVDVELKNKMLGWMKDQLTGGFHIWPKEKSQREEKEEEISLEVVEKN